MSRRPNTHKQRTPVVTQAPSQTQEVANLLARGVALHQQGQLAHASLMYEQVLARQPWHFDALHLLGVIAAQTKKPARAVDLIDRALKVRPKHAPAHNNRGNALKDLGQFGEALASFDQAIAFKPDYVNAHNNRGILLKQLRRLDEALSSFDRAITLQPDFAEAHWNKSLALLLSGQFDSGWDLYEWRWKKGDTSGHRRDFGQPRWNGADSSARLLIWPEQGIGDEIMFSCLVDEAYRRCPNLLVQADPRLIPLFERSFRKEIQFVATNASLDSLQFELQISMGSLGLLYRRSAASFRPPAQGHLRADETKAASLASQVRREPGFKYCGISWRSKSENTGEVRSLSLLTLLQALGHAGWKFVNLQYGDVADEQRDVSEKLGIEVISVAEIDNFTDIDGLASLIQCCDLVVTIGNLTAHLAGAIGKPTWVLLPHVPDWRWMLDGDDSPWYRSIKLYRQDGGRSWTPVLQRVADDMARVAQAVP